MATLQGREEKIMNAFGHFSCNLKTEKEDLFSVVGTSTKTIEKVQ